MQPRVRLPGPTGLLWAASAVILGAIVLEPLWDPDLWWHLATGQWIHVHAQVPRADPFAVDGAVKPWLAHEWLFELLLYWAFRAGGERLLVLLPAMAAVATAAFGLRRAALREVPAALGAPGVFVALMPTQDFWTQRPQLLTFLLLSWLLLDLQKHADGAKIATWRWTLLVAFWANVHGAFVVAVLAIAAHLAGALVEWLGGVEDARRRAKELGVLAAAVLAAGLLNPRGLHLYGHAWMYASSDWHGVAIVDWQSPTFADPRRLLFAVVVLTAFVFAAVSRAARPGDLFLLAGFTLMALRWQRNIPLALIAAAPLCAIWLDRAWLAWRRLERTTREPARDVSWLRGVLHLAALLVLGLLGVASRWPCRGATCERAGAFPSAAVAFLEGGPLASVRTLNHFDWGGYLLWRRPGREVYIDGRAPELDLERLHLYGRIHRLEPGWRELLREQQIDLVLYPRGSALARALEADGWEPLFEDETAVVLSSPGAAAAR